MRKNRTRTRKRGKKEEKKNGRKKRGIRRGGGNKKEIYTLKFLQFGTTQSAIHKDYYTRRKFKYYDVCFLYKILCRTQFIWQKLLNMTPNRYITIVECIDSNFLLIKTPLYTESESHTKCYLINLCSFKLWQPQSWGSG